MDEWCNSLWSLNEQELRKKRKTLEAGLEKLLHTKRLKEFTALLFSRVQQIILSLIAPKRRSATRKKQNYIQ